MCYITAGPFKLNGVPLRRVNQSYVIGTSTTLDISGVDVAKYDDSYFAKEAKKRKKKTEGEFFEGEKEVRLCNISIRLYFYYVILNNFLIVFVFPSMIQGKKALPQEKKDDQKAVDSQLLKAIEAVPDMKSYLSARFTLKDGMKPHELKF